MATRKKTPKGHPSKAFKPSKKDTADAADRAPKIWRELKKAYPDAGCALVYRDALQMLIATILSAQCTDQRVNIVTQDLFKRYRTAADFAQADQAELEEMIRSTGFFRNKAKNIRAACQEIVTQHDGKVPADRDALTSLPGVGRKTANVVLGNVFGEPAMVTDTHVLRLSRLLGLTRATEPEKVEHDLMALFAPRQWTMLGHLLIFHGRAVCIASRPQCDRCCLQCLCAYGQKALAG